MSISSPLPGSFLARFQEIIQQSQRIAVIAHFRPDGDALGSIVAMGELLRTRFQREAVLLNRDAVPANLAFIPGVDRIRLTEGVSVDQFDTIVILDCGDLKRLGPLGFELIQAREQRPLLVNIDHHETNTIHGDLNCVLPEECSTSAILYYMFHDLGVTISPIARDALYIGISTDTGSFQYERTTPEVMEMGAELLRLGVHVQDVNRKLYQEVSKKKLLLTREVLNGMQFSVHGQIASFLLRQAVKERLGVTEEDTDGLIDILRSAEGVVLAAFLEEITDRVRVSLRSKNPAISVSKIAESFGGGGHAMAAGIQMKCTADEALSQIHHALEQALAVNLPSA